MLTIPKMDNNKIFAVQNVHDERMVNVVNMVFIVHTSVEIKASNKTFECTNLLYLKSHVLAKNR